MLRCRSAQEAVADSPDGLDRLPEAAQLLSQTADVVVDRPVVALEIAAPDALDQELTVEGATGVGGEERQQLELLWGQGQPHTVELGVVSPAVEAERTAEDRRPAPPAR